MGSKGFSDLTKGDGVSGIDCQTNEVIYWIKLHHAKTREEVFIPPQIIEYYYKEESGDTVLITRGSEWPPSRESEESRVIESPETIERLAKNIAGIDLKKKLLGC
jgi:hypothetical protein